ncbi:hypothetical protein IPM65_05145 [Candidatus Roizmanbacteria bacterium]|nr:MAG: hypothetical protein IPM65_05145 [Candidatus Roizmanbacteria bacterium]
MSIHKLNNADTSFVHFASAVKDDDVLIVKSENECAATRLAGDNQLYIVLSEGNSENEEERWVSWMSIPSEILVKLLRASAQPSVYEALNEIWAYVEYMGGWSDEFESVFSERSPITTERAIELLGYDWREHL